MTYTVQKTPRVFMVCSQAVEVVKDVQLYCTVQDECAPPPHTQTALPAGLLRKRLSA